MRNALVIVKLCEQRKRAQSFIHLELIFLLITDR